MNLTYMSTEFMNSASRACRSTRHRSTAPVTRLDTALAHERQVNLVRSCNPGHSSQDIGTRTPRTVCPALRSVVQDAEDWMPDLRSVMRQVFLQVRALLALALSLAVGQAVKSTAPRTHHGPQRRRAKQRSGLDAERSGPGRPLTGRRKVSGTFPTSADESTPRRSCSRRNTRHVCLRQPMPTPATLIHKALNKSQSPDLRSPRRCTGGP